MLTLTHSLRIVFLLALTPLVPPGKVHRRLRQRIHPTDPTRRHRSRTCSFPPTPTINAFTKWESANILRSCMGHHKQALAHLPCLYGVLEIHWTAVALPHTLPNLLPSIRALLSSSNAQHHLRTSSLHRIHRIHLMFIHSRTPVRVDLRPPPCNRILAVSYV